MAEKIDINHLAPYLAYDVRGVKGENRENIRTLLSIDRVVGLKVEGVFENYPVWGFDEFKPVLRPLSDLTKRIEHRGDEFIPICTLLNSKEGELIVKNITGGLPALDRIEVYSDPDTLIETIFIGNIVSQPYKRFRRLFEWHFDVFGLIDKGMAVDINSLKRKTIINYYDKSRYFE